MSAPITEAHRKLRETFEIRWMRATELEIEQLIADSEARAVAQWSGGLDQSLPDLYEAAKAERDAARAEVERLKADGAASAFVAMACRASRAETDRNNLRADKARLDWLEKARPIAWALGSEECGEYWILTDTGEKHPEEAEEFATLRAAIDAAMKEGTK